LAEYIKGEKDEWPAQGRLWQHDRGHTLILRTETGQGGLFFLWSSRPYTVICFLLLVTFYFYMTALITRCYCYPLIIVVGGGAW